MGSSHGFGSTPCDYSPFSDSLSLRLRVYSPLTSPQRVTRWLILQKARGQSCDLPLLVSTRFQILFHSGYPGSFHLSLTVLVHYRSPRVFSLGEWTPLLPTGLACPVVLKLSDGSQHAFAYGTLTLSGRPSQYLSASISVCNSLGPLQQPCRRSLPPVRNACKLGTHRV